MKKSIYEVDKQDTQEAYMTTGIVSKNGSSATFGFYDTDGTLERISACPLEAIGFRSVGANFGTEHLENMSRLAARYNAVNGDDFMMVAPASATYYGRTTMLSVYVQPEGTGSKTFRDELEAMVRLAQGYDPKIIALDKVTAYMPDEASRRAFLANPTFDAALEAMDKAAGLDSKAMDAGPFPTEDEVMAVIKARTLERNPYAPMYGMTKDDIAKQEAFLREHEGVVVMTGSKEDIAVDYNHGGEMFAGTSMCRLWLYKEHGEHRCALETVADFGDHEKTSMVRSDISWMTPEDGLLEAKTAMRRGWSRTMGQLQEVDRNAFGQLEEIVEQKRLSRGRSSFLSQFSDFVGSTDFSSASLPGFDDGDFDF